MPEQTQDTQQTCPHCGTPTSLNNNHLINTTETVCCESCAAICADCGTIHPRDQMHYERGELYCRNCIESCYECGETHALVNMTEIGEDSGNLVCDDCKEEYYTQCEHCGNLYINDEMQIVEVTNPNNPHIEDWCRHCRDREPLEHNEERNIEQICIIGGTVYPHEERRPINWPTGPQNDRNRIFQDYLSMEASRQRCPICMNSENPCADCLEKRAKQAKKEETTLWVYDTQVCNYHESCHDRFKSLIYRVKHEHPYLYYGVELEVVFKDDANKQQVVHDFIVATNGLFVAEYDRSVDKTGNGAEFISRPLSYKAWASNYIQTLLNAGFKVLTDAGAKVDQPIGCGMHVHMSRTFFEHNTQKNTKQIKDDIDWFFQIYQEEIEAISGRPFTRYCTSKALKVKETLPHFLSQDLGLNINYSISKGKIPSTENNRDNHHYAIVLTNKTIEVRTFKSTLDLTQFMANIQFCRVIAHAARNMKTTQKTTFADIISCKESPQLDIIVQKKKIKTDKKFANTLEVE